MVVVREEWMEEAGGGSWVKLEGGGSWGKVVRVVLKSRVKKEVVGKTVGQRKGRPRLSFKSKTTLARKEGKK